MKLRDELLNGEIFYTLLEAKVLIERWREHYNRIRPHSSLGYRPPAPEAIAFSALTAGFAPPTADLGSGGCRTNIASGIMDGGRSGFARRLELGSAWTAAGTDARAFRVACATNRPTGLQRLRVD